MINFLFFHKIFKTQLLSRAYHEAAHCSVAAIFTNKLVLKTLTINKKLAKEVNPAYAGGLSMSFKIIPKDNNPEPGDNLILIACAGICGRTIHSKGFEYVRNNISIFHTNDKLMDTRGAEDDYGMMQKYSKPIGNIFSTSYSIIEWSAFRWTYEFLMDERIWEATKKIAEALIKKPDRTFNEVEILDIIEKSGLKNYLDNNKSVFLDKRYPLKPEKFAI